jgi:hypothetical protein
MITLCKSLTPYGILPPEEHLALSLSLYAVLSPRRTLKQYKRSLKYHQGQEAPYVYKIQNYANRDRHR